MKYRKIQLNLAKIKGFYRQLETRVVQFSGKNEQCFLKNIFGFTPGAAKRAKKTLDVGPTLAESLKCGIKTSHTVYLVHGAVENVTCSLSSVKFRIFVIEQT